MTVTVPLPQGGYPVHIQPGALRQTGALLAPLGIDRWAVTTDETVAALYGGAVLDSLRSAGLSGQLLTFPAGEAHKTPETWLSLCRQLAQEGFTRSDGLLALGGGVTGDMAGFVAACYQRGMALCTCGASAACSCPPRCSLRWTAPWAVKRRWICRRARTCWARSISPGW